MEAIIDIVLYEGLAERGKTVSPWGSCGSDPRLRKERTCIHAMHLERNEVGGDGRQSLDALGCEQTRLFGVLLQQVHLVTAAQMCKRHNKL